MVKPKNEIRKEILEKRCSLAEEEVIEKSRSIKKRLFGIEEFKQAKLIMLYASFKNEVKTMDMAEEAISLGKKIAFPLTSKKDGIRPFAVYNIREDLAPGYFGVLEPKIKKDRKINLKELDMIVVPGIAFDRYCSRIGFGKGYYDRFLRSLLPRPFCVGLAFEMQIVDNIYREEWDEKLDMVITEKNVYG